MNTAFANSSDLDKSKQLTIDLKDKLLVEKWQSTNIPGFVSSEKISDLIRNLYSDKYVQKYKLILDIHNNAEKRVLSFFLENNMLQNKDSFVIILPLNIETLLLFSQIEEYFDIVLMGLPIATFANEDTYNIEFFINKHKKGFFIKNITIINNKKQNKETNI